MDDPARSRPMTAGPQSDDKGQSAAFPRRGPRRPPPKPPPGIGCAAKPALEPEHSMLGRPNLIRWSPPNVEVFHFRALAWPAQRFLGGGFGRGAKPPSEWNVQGVRLACGPRAPPCSWTLLIALAQGFSDSPLEWSAPRGLGEERSTMEPTPKR